MLHRRWRPRVLKPDAAEAAMMENLHALARRNGVKLRTRLLAGGKVDEAVLHQIHHGKHNLLVLGVQPASATASASAPSRTVCWKTAGARSSC